MREETDNEYVMKDFMEILGVVHWFLIKFENKDFVSCIKQEECEAANWY